MSSIGLVGAGDMGGRMAKRLIAAGHELAVCDVNPAVLASFSADGIVASMKPASIAGGDVIILMVSNDEQIENAIDGEGGIKQGLDSTRSPVILIMSTCMPTTVLAAQKSVSRLGASVVDAPVSGGLGGAEAGTLSIMVGGETNSIDRILPVLDCLGSKIFRCGALGMGQTTKLLNNLIGLSNLYIVSEAYAIAQQAGLELEALLPALDASAGRNFISRDAKASRQQFATWASSPEAFEALSRIVRKDIRSASMLAERHGVKTPALQSLSGELGSPNPDIYARWRDLAGLD